MNKQDAIPIKSYTEVERRLKGLYKEIESANTQVIRINSELSSIIQSLLINLTEYMNQGDISLWFFSGIPTLENEPYIDWTTVSDHAGDLYYNRSTGTVYQFNGENWTELEDEKLIETMAITNAELSPNDNERKVFIQTPTPPYQVGDWWIKDDGTLFICQKDNTTAYNESDFIISSFYSLTATNKIANNLSILEQSLGELSESVESIESDIEDLTLATSPQILKASNSQAVAVSSSFQELITFTEKVCIGDQITVDENNHIVVGSNVSKIKVTAIIQGVTTNNGGYIYGYVKHKHSDESSYTRVSNYYRSYLPANNFSTFNIGINVVITDIVSVQEGDEFIITVAGDNVTISIGGAILLIEKIK